LVVKRSLIDFSHESGILDDSYTILELLKFLEFGSGSFVVSPPGIVVVIPVFPFVNENSVGAQRFDVVLNGRLHAADGGQHADDAEYPERDTQKRKKGPEFIRPEFLQRHFQAGKDDIDITGQRIKFELNIGKILRNLLPSILFPHPVIKIVLPSTDG
jgi:hypothetical protein